MLIQGNQLLTSPGAQPAMTSLTSAMPLRRHSPMLARDPMGTIDTVKPAEPIERTGPSERDRQRRVLGNSDDHRDQSFDDIGSA